MKDFAQLVAEARTFGWRLLTPGNALSQRVVHASFWAFSLRVVDRLFGLARTVVLARLLAPSDFGLYGIALLALSMLETFSETGFNAAIIQKKGDVKPYLDTAWTVQVIRGWLLALLLLVIAPYVAMFFGEPGATSLVRALALVTVLRGLVNTGVLYFRKELEFHKEFLYMFSGTLVDMAVAIPAALILRNAWALIFGLVAGQFVRVVVSYFVHPYRPRFRLERTKARELFRFGRWVFGSHLGVYIATHGDDIIVGKFLGAAALGIYQLAFRLSNTMATEITEVFSMVSFPTFSMLQEDRRKLEKAFVRFLEATLFLSVPLTGGFLVLTEDFVSIFLGSSWIPVATPMKILAIAGFLRSVAATGGPLFRGVGKPHLGFWLVFSRVVVTFSLIWFWVPKWDVSGAAAAVVVGFFVSIPYWLFASMKVAGLRFQQLVSTLLPSLVAGLVMAATLGVTKWVLSPLDVASFMVVGFLSVASYTLAFLLFCRWTGRVPLGIQMPRAKGGRRCPPLEM